MARYDTKHRRDRDQALKELERLQVQRKRDKAADERRALAESGSAVQPVVVPPEPRHTEDENGR